ncbi:Interference hedgehog-like protein [Leptotrombidium deliense]|uniref:Interference hedgehog-like protein n=1 Tax=Leptotrombidium deliense TaxID=299467 RepID=A0A443S333_9ACAR|nr:Interference hedgehog-like protein [Leptotrombidium deliense]
MHVITHLLPDTAYDIKMQSFNVAGASEFSSIITARTMKNPDLEKKPENEEGNLIPNVPIPVTSKHNVTLYYTIGIAAGTLILVFIVFVVVCIVRNKQNFHRPKKPLKVQPLTSVATDYTHSNGHYSSNNKLNNHPTTNGISEKVVNINGFGMHKQNESLDDCELMKIHVNPLLSQGTSMHHLNSNGKHFATDTRMLTSMSQTSLHTSEERKSPFVDERYPKFYGSARMNGRVRSFTRLNGTLERKKKSRTDLADTKECEPMLNNGRCKSEDSKKQSEVQCSTESTNKDCETQRGAEDDWLSCFVNKRNEKSNRKEGRLAKRKREEEEETKRVYKSRELNTNLISKSSVSDIIKDDFFIAKYCKRDKETASTQEKQKEESSETQEKETKQETSKNEESSKKSLTEEEKNKLNARLLKAELMGNSELVAQLKQALKDGV